MSVDLLIMTDGRRDCFLRTLVSAMQAFIPGSVWVHDDSGDPAYRAFLHETFRLVTDAHIFGPADGRSGFGGAIRSAWATLQAESTADYIFHLEDDFTFNAPVPLGKMRAVLEHHPYIVQVALRRQAWNPVEIAAGGVVEANPNAYTQRQCVCPMWEQPSYYRTEWLEHREFFTTNPSLYRRSLLDVGWPGGDQSEGVFTHRLLADPDVRFAYWGSRIDDPWVHHIGDERVGTGY